MYAVVVCDTLRGATGLVAKRIAEGLHSHAFRVDVVELDEDLDRVADAQFVVIGCRSAAALRDWISGLDEQGVAAAVFVCAPPDRGAASWDVDAVGLLRDVGFDLVAAPNRFATDEQGRLVAGESGRAREWGRTLASRVAFVDSYA